MGTRGAPIAVVTVAGCLLAPLLAGCGDEGRASARAAGDNSDAPRVAETSTDRPEDLGCTPDGAPYPIGPWHGDTQQAALTAMVEDAFSDETVYEIDFLADTDGTLGPRFVLRVDWRGASSTGAVHEVGGRWTASLDQACAERLAPPYDPLDGWSEDVDPVHLTCTSDGTTADRTTVVAAHDGVHVEVDDRTGWAGAALQVGSPGHYAPLGGPPVGDAAGTPLDLAPGEWLVGCSPGHMAPAAHQARITVVAGPDIWRPPIDRVPCGHGGAPDFFDGPPTGRTEQEALRAALDMLSPGQTADSRVRLYDDGYWRTPGHGFVVLRPGPDSAVWGRTEPVGGGRWRATFTELTCPPA